MKTCPHCGQNLKEPELTDRLVEALNNTFERVQPRSKKEVVTTFNIMRAVCAAISGSHEESLLTAWLVMREEEESGFIERLGDLPA